MQIKDCKVTDDYVLFWDSVFSQWHPARFTVGGVEYANAEQYMMCNKASTFNDEDAFHRILNSKSPAEAKAIGRQVKNYDDSTWNKARVGVVIKGNYHKFSQNPEMKDILLSTGTRILVEASPHDKIWGIGLGENDARALNPGEWRGYNLLGYSLVIVRSMLSG